MKLTDHIVALEHVEARLNTHWNFYAVTVLAIGAWLFGGYGDFSQNEPALIWGLIGALVIFFSANLTSLYNVLRRIRVLELEIAALVPEADIRTPALQRHLRRKFPLRFVASMMVHVVVDVVLIAIVLNKAGLLTSASFGLIG